MLNDPFDRDIDFRALQHVLGSLNVVVVAEQGAKGLKSDTYHWPLRSFHRQDSLPHVHAIILPEHRRYAKFLSCLNQARQILAEELAQDLVDHCRMGRKEVALLTM